MKKAESKLYGECKKQYQFALTETASKLIDEVANISGVSRSEVIEQSARENVLKVKEQIV